MALILAMALLSTASQESSWLWLLLTCVSLLGVRSRHGPEPPGASVKLRSSRRQELSPGEGPADPLCFTREIWGPRNRRAQSSLLWVIWMACCHILVLPLSGCATLGSSFNVILSPLRPREHIDSHGRVITKPRYSGQIGTGCSLQAEQVLT